MRLALLFAFVSACRTPTPTTALLEAPATEGPSGAQLFNESQQLFDEQINEIHVHLNSGTFTKMVTHVSQGGDACKDNARYGHVQRFTFKNTRTGRETELRDVGMRVRGNTSCGNFRKSYKFKFNADATAVKNAAGQPVEFISRVFENNGDNKVFGADDAARIADQNLFGMKSTTLRASTNDPTTLRDRLGSEVFAFGGEVSRNHRERGAPERGGAVYRTGFARLWVHKGGGAEDFGIYAVTEQIDKTMMKARWDKDIKHAYQTNLARGTLRDAPSDQRALFKAYEPGFVDGEGLRDDIELGVVERLVSAGRLESEILEKERALRGKAERTLRDFIAALARVDSRESLAQLIDVDNLLNYMVAVNLTGHWDSALGNANNDWLVWNKKIERWQVVVWDLDNTFGSVATGPGPFNTVWNAKFDEFKRGGTDLLAGNERPLLAKVMRFYAPEYKARYQEFLAGGYDLHRMDGRIAAVRNLLVGENRDPLYETLFTFKNHRWAHATCNITRGQRAVIRGGVPAFENYNEKKPVCE